MKKITLFLVIAFIVQESVAQTPTTVAQTTTKTKQYSEQIWLGYLNQGRISKKWGFWLDLQLRTKDNFFDSLSTAMIRPGITYYASEKLKFTVGYTYNNIFPADNHSGVSQPDQRLWQQVQWNTNYERIRLMQWIRLEERWRRKIENADELAEGYNFNFRLRYNFFFQLPITKKAYEKGSLCFVVNDELMVNFGKQIVYNYFDQNRLFTGLQYYFNKDNNIQLNYLNVFLQTSSGNSYKIVNGVRLFYTQTIDFRKNS